MEFLKLPLSANYAGFHLEGHIYVCDTPWHNYVLHIYFANFIILVFIIK